MKHSKRLNFWSMLFIIVYLFEILLSFPELEMFFKSECNIIALSAFRWKMKCVKTNPVCKVALTVQHYSCGVLSLILSQILLVTIQLKINPLQNFNATNKTIFSTLHTNLIVLSSGQVHWPGSLQDITNLQ